MQSRQLNCAVVLSTLTLLAGTGCNCQPETKPDASAQPTLEWPAGARLKVTATTESTADLKWPEALGPVASYRLAWPGTTRDEAGTSTRLIALVAGTHLPVELVAVGADGATTTPLKAEVSPATKLDVPDGDISTDFCAANTFLAVGVAIPCATMSVLTGHALTRDGSGVPGLAVSILEHPEWGTATTQADGLYALAVAAGRMTLQLKASAFVPIHRGVAATGREFATVPDVVVLRRDEKATIINTAAGGFHVGTLQEDKDGQRSTAIFIPRGTTAVLRLADGGTTPAPTLTLRATEATVGPRGQEAMPATLPAATAYTFAADISADEALAVGARGVGFPDWVAMYADNFQKFEVGVTIPLGAYDTQTATWEALPDALVVQLTEGGQLDITGDGKADAELPMLAGEAEALAGHYAVGTQLVRSLTKHFSTLDANTAWLCVGTCQALGEAAASGHNPWCDGECGSLVRVQNRTVSEFVGVSGTGLTLGWHSHRTQARKPTVDFRMGESRDGGAPVGTKGVSYVLEVAGQRLSAGSNDGGYGDTAALSWNGADVFGRPVRGTVSAVASTGYGFGGVSISLGRGRGGIVDLRNSFGAIPADGVAVGPTREAVFLMKKTRLTLGDWVPRENLGTLSLDVVHGYTEDGTLHLGTGGEMPGDAVGPLMKRVAIAALPSGYDTLGNSPLLAEGAQHLYVVRNARQVVRVELDGGVTNVGGSDSTGFAGDGLAATQGLFSTITGLVVDRDENLFIADTANYRIRRIDGKTGLLSTVVGTGQQGWSPDGTPATQASLDSLNALLLGQDGFLYFMAWNPTTRAQYVRRVENGVLRTVAGAPDAPSFEGTTPFEVQFRGSEHSMAQGADGSLYIAGYDSGGRTSGSVVRRIEPGGRVRLLAGLGESRNPWETNALATCILPRGASSLAVGADDVVYLSEASTGCGPKPGVRAIFPDGTITQLVGSGTVGVYTALLTDGPAALQDIYLPGAILLRRNGNLLMSHRSSLTTLHEIFIDPSFERTIPSPDGSEVYIFDRGGRHLRTYAARTGLLLWSFTWGPNGLERLVDLDGEVTTVERMADGRVRALVSPDGQRTKVTLDGAGRANRVEDAAGRFVEVAYGAGGQVSEWKDENGNVTAFEWDAWGNLAAEVNAEGARKRFERGRGGVKMTTAEGRETLFLQGGGRTVVLQTRRNPDGTESHAEYRPGLQRFTSADGTTTEVAMQAAAGGRFQRTVQVPGRVTVKTPSGLESSSSFSRGTTTPAGEPLAVSSEVGEARLNAKVWRSEYLADAGTVTVTTPEGRVASMTLDAKRRPLVVTSPGVLPVTSAYDGRGRLVSMTQGQRSVTLAWGAEGYLASTRNALGEVTALTTDGTGRLLKVTRADSKDVGLQSDPVGNLTSVTPPDAGTHRFAYDKVSRPTTYSAPEVAGVVSETTTYDADGLATRAGHSDSTQTVVTREPSGRVKQVTTPWWVNDFTYTATTGQVASLTRGTQRLEWQYDGFFVKEEKAIGVAPATSQWGYDTDFRVASHSLNGVAVTYVYDRDSLLTRAGAATLGRTPSTGQLASVTVGSVATAVTFNPYGELATLATTASATALYSEGLSYDAAGRITVVEEVVQGAPVQWVYGYDKLGQLVSASKNGALPTTWAYDGNGNRLTADGIASTFDAQDRLKTSGSVAYEWDALGGRLSKTEGSAVTQYAHDGLGALLSVTLPDATVVTYQYDGQQRRVAKLRNGTVVKRWVYDGQYRVVAEVDAGGAVASRFVYASHSHSPEYLVRGGVTYAYVKNHLGSVKLVVDAASGTVAQRLEYDAWGNVTENSSPELQPFAFAGGVYDIDTGFTHFGFRDYDAAPGVWTAKDPLRWVVGEWSLIAGRSHGRMLNSFQYSLADPVRVIDFSGLAPKDKLFSLPKKFWNWYHRKAKRLGDADLEKEEAQDLFEHWKKEGCPGPDGKGKHKSPSTEGSDGDDFLDFVVPFPVLMLDPAKLLKDWMPEIFGLSGGDLA